MTSTAKRPRIKAARKGVARKPAGKSSARKPAAKKSLAAKSSGKRVSATTKTTAKNKRLRAKTGKPAKRGAPKKMPAVRTRAKKAEPKKVPAKKAPRKLSPEAKKKLAARHLWELVEAKKRRAAQPPSWQNIGHHDHAVPGSRTVETAPTNVEPEKFLIGGRLDRGGG